MYKKRVPRFSYIFTVIAWVIIISSIIVVFHQIQAAEHWTAAARHRIDVFETIFMHVGIAALITSIVSWIFYEIQHSRMVENILVRRFLPVISVVIHVAVWIIAFFDLLEKLSIDTKSILTGAGISGAILALAAKDMMTNFMGSLSILLGRIFDIGETIRVNTPRARYEGIVEQITMNYTKLTNVTGEVIYMPNRTIYSETVENLSRKRFHTYVYLVPFSKTTSTSRDIKERMRIIEWKLSEYDPLSISWDMENPNSWDFMYRITVKFPEENEQIDREIRTYLVEHIFRA